MASYAPLFAHVDGWQWTPNLIWFDNLRSFGTPNYYVQKLFSNNQGTKILPVLLNGSPRNAQENLYASASFDSATRDIILKVVNTTNNAREIRINLAGGGRLGSVGKASVLKSTDLKMENSLDQPRKLSPTERQFQVPSADFTFGLDPSSLTVLRIPTR